MSRWTRARTSRSWRPRPNRAAGGTTGRPPTKPTADRPVRVGAVTDRPDDWRSAIANGYGIAPAPAARYYARSGIVYRPVARVSPSRVGFAWALADDTDAVVQDFVRCRVDSVRQDAYGLM